MYYKYAPPACACQWFLIVFVRVLFPRGIQFLLEVEGVFRRHPCRISGRDAEQQFRWIPTASPRHRAARACSGCRDAGVDAYPRLLERRRRRTTLFFDKTRVTYQIVRIQVPPTFGGCISSSQCTRLCIYTGLSRSLPQGEGCIMVVVIIEGPRGVSPGRTGFTQSEA